MARVSVLPTTPARSRCLTDASVNGRVNGSLLRGAIHRPTLPPPSPLGRRPLLTTKVICIYSSDARLIERIRAELRDSERLLALEPDQDRGLANVGGDIAAVVIDNRFAPASSDADIAKYIQHQTEAQIPRIEIVAPLQPHDVEVVGYAGSKATVVRIADSEGIGALIRAIANDPTGSEAAAVALAAIERYVTEPARAIPRLVLGGGGTPSSVKELETVLHRDRTSIERSLRRASSLVPSAALDLAKATRAVALLRRTKLSLLATARAVRFSRGSVLEDCVQRVFARRLAELRSASPDMDINDYLRSLVRRYIRGASGPLTPPSGIPI